MTAARETILRDMLEKIAAEKKYDRPNIEITTVPTTGSNFTSQLFHATVTSKGKDDLYLFAKVSIIGETLRNTTNCSDFYAMEPYFYTNVVTKFEAIEKENNVPEEHRVNIPKFYGGSTEFMKELVVLGDLSKDGFVTYDRQKSVDWEYASKSVEQMAKFHAIFIAYQEKYPEHYEEAKKFLKRPMMDESDLFTDMFNQCVEQTVHSIKEDNRPRFRKYFANKDLDLKMFYRPFKRPVVIHSDFRPSNLMHKVDEGGNLKVAVVDFQTMHPGSVACDLVYFIFCGSDAEFREKYYDKLIEHYYENLVQALKRLGLDPEVAFPRAVFDEELKEALPYGLIIAVMLLPLITIDLENVPTAPDGSQDFESLDKMTDMFSKVNSLGTRRINEVVDDFIRWGIL